MIENADKAIDRSVLNTLTISTMKSRLRNVASTDVSTRYYLLNYYILPSPFISIIILLYIIELVTPPKFSKGETGCDFCHQALDRGDLLDGAVPHTYINRRLLGHVKEGQLQKRRFASYADATIAWGAPHQPQRLRLVTVPNTSDSKRRGTPTP